MSQNPAKLGASRYFRLFITALIVFALDQGTKLLVAQNLPFGRSYYAPDWIPVIDGFFYIVHIGNEGAAWGMFSGHGGPLSIFAGVALLTIYFCRNLLQLYLPSMQLIFGGIIGGILGNTLDRLMRGHVVDFLDFHFPFTVPGFLPDGRYPAFNIADCGIVIGTLSYIYLSYRLEKHTKKVHKH